MKTIKNFPNYVIDENGVITNQLKNKSLKQFVSNGYYKVNLYLDNTNVKSLYVHRIVAENFIPNPENKKEVNHRDGNKLNNEISNLEWATRKENANHSWRYGLQKSKKGKYSLLSKQVLQYDLDGNFIKKWNSVMDIERELGFKSGGISNCCLGKSKRSGKFIWKYDE
jgi:hypothetical protein